MGHPEASTAPLLCTHTPLTVHAETDRLKEMAYK